MKKKAVKINYTDPSPEEDFDAPSSHLSEKQKERLGIPTVAQARAYIAKKAKEERFNIRASTEDLEGFKIIAEEIGIPYQSLASVILHQVATRKIKIVFSGEAFIQPPRKASFKTPTLRRALA